MSNPKMAIPPPISKPNNRNSNNKSKRKAATRPERASRRRSSANSSNFDEKRTVKSPVMEKVKILKRGEPLESTIKTEMSKKDNEDPVVCGTGSSSTPDSKPEPRSSNDLKSPIEGCGFDSYAGLGFFTSPEPSSLPLPSFSKRKSVLAIVEDSATMDLRRLLRLDAQDSVSGSEDPGAEEPDERGRKI